MEANNPNLGYMENRSNRDEAIEAYDAFGALKRDIGRDKQTTREVATPDKTVTFRIDDTFADSDTVAMLEMGGKGLILRKGEEGQLIINDELQAIESPRAASLVLYPGESTTIGRETIGQGLNDRVAFIHDPDRTSGGLRGQHRDLEREHGQIGLSEDAKTVTVKGLQTGRGYEQRDTSVEVMRPISRRRKLARKVGMVTAAAVVAGSSLLGLSAYKEATHVEQYTTIVEQELPETTFSEAELAAYESIDEQFGISAERTVSPEAETALEAIESAASVDEVNAALNTYFEGHGVNSYTLDTDMRLGNLINTNRVANGVESLENIKTATIASIDVFDRMPAAMIDNSNFRNIIFVEDLMKSQQGDNGLNGFAQSRLGNLVIDTATGDIDQMRFTIAHEFAHLVEENDPNIARFRTMLQPLTNTTNGAPEYAEIDRGNHSVINHDNPQAEHHGQRFHDRNYGNDSIGEDYADVLAGVFLNRFDVEADEIHGVDEQKKRVAAMWLEVNYPNAIEGMFQANLE